MPKVQVYTAEGAKAGVQELPDSLFNVTIDAKLVAEVIRIARANRRQTYAHTKTRADVSGGGKKPWRQKGTGRARHGSIRSPIWKGGGVTHGPRSGRNYTLKVNAKTRRTALAMTLSDKVKSSKLILVEDLSLPEGKTKLLTGILAKLPVERPLLVAMPTSNSTVYRASRNLRDVETIRADSLNVEAVVGAHSLLIPKPSLDRILATFARPTRKVSKA
jgi:large subunit ribosomal protein L4